MSHFERFTVDLLAWVCQSAALCTAHIRLWRLLLLGSLILIVSGCSSLGTGSSEQTLINRSEQRWQALIDNDFTAAYGFETPGYRSVYSVEAYRNRFGEHARWKSVRVRSVEIDNDVAHVKLALDFQSQLANGQMIDSQRFIEERWLLIEGEWWYSGR